MSWSDALQSIGAAAGVLALGWNLVNQTFGTFTDRTLKDTVDGNRQDMQQMMDRIERIVDRLAPLQRRR